MKKKYTRKSNPVNSTGYTPGYSTESNPYNIIPSEDITMRNTPYPVQGTPLDQNWQPIGNSVTMQPGQDYKFGGASYVFETPSFAAGGTKQSWISDKIGKLVNEGYPQKQAIAIAYSMYNQHHANGGYQLPEYQIGDEFGKTNNQVGFAQGFGNPDYSANPNVEAKPDYNKDYMNMSTADEKLVPPIDYNKEYMSMSTEDEKLKQPEDAGKKAREAFEGNTMYQFNNPYGGYSMQDSLFNAGQAVEEGDTFGAIANSANVLLKGSKDFLAGMGSANRQQQDKATYYQKQREGMTGQNTAIPMGKRGGRFSMPQYQNAGVYDENNPYGYEGNIGDNESMDKYINSANQKNAILLRREPEATVEQAPAEAPEQATTFDSKSARDTWVYKTGMPWSKAKELGYTTGSAQDNMKLLSELNDNRFRKENLRTEAPKRKTANRKAIELQPKRLPANINAYGIDTNAPEVIAYRNAVDKKSAEEDAKKPFGYGKPAYVNKNQAMLSGARPAVQTQSKSVMFPNYVPEGQQNPFSLYQEGGQEGTYSNPQEEQGEQGNPQEQIVNQIAGALQQGAQPQQILQQLVQMGMSQEEATQAIQSVMQQMQGGQQEGTPQLSHGGYYQVGGQQRPQSVMYGNVKPQQSDADKAFGTMSERASARKQLVERDMKRPMSTAMQMPLTYLENPLKILGDVTHAIAPGTKVGDFLPNSEGDRREILQNRYNQNISNSERLHNTWNMGTKKAPMAAVNVGAGLYFAGEKGAGAVANEIFNPAKQVQHVMHGQGTVKKVINAAEVGAHHTAGHGLEAMLYHQEGGMQSPEEVQGEAPQQEQVQQIMQQISQALQQGSDPQQILQQLVQMGIPQEQAQQMIQMAMQQAQGGQQQAPQGTPQLRKGGCYQEGGEAEAYEARTALQANQYGQDLQNRYDRLAPRYEEGGEAMDEQMEGENEGAEGETPSMEQIEGQVEQALKQGADPQQVLQQLVQMGVPQEQAVQMIQELLKEIQGGETEMEEPEQGNPQMRAGGKYLEILKGKTIKGYNLNKKTGNYEVQYS